MLKRVLDSLTSSLRKLSTSIRPGLPCGAAFQLCGHVHGGAWWRSTGSTCSRHSSGSCWPWILYSRSFNCSTIHGGSRSCSCLWPFWRCYWYMLGWLIWLTQLSTFGFHSFPGTWLCSIAGCTVDSLAHSSHTAAGCRRGTDLDTSCWW